MQTALGYCRVSSQKQNVAGVTFSLDAQKEIVTTFCKQRGLELTSIRVEVESGRRSDNRPELQAALTECRATGKTLIISRLDRLSRNPGFLLSLKESNVSFQCCDLPDCNQMTLAVLACVASQESLNVSVRTATALRQKKAQCEAAGVPFFKSQSENCKRIQPLGVAKRKAAASSRLVARRKGILAIFNTTGQGKYSITSNLLNELGVPSMSGEGQWHPASVARIVNFKTA